MKRLFIISLVLMLSLPAFAQKEKVVESSRKEKPTWIGISDKNSISITSSGKTITEASDQCLAYIRQYIVNSVAVNISASSQMSKHQITKDNLVSVMSENSTDVTTEAASLPYVSDLSLSNATDIYWEKIYDKQTKTYRYEYSVLYPFTEATRNEMIEFFLKRDKEKNDKYEKLRDELNTFDNLDNIKIAINELEALEKYFFDPVRKNDVKALISNYRSQYNLITIEVLSEAFESCNYCLSLNGRRVTTSVAPRIKGESIIEAAVRPNGDKSYTLTYNGKYASSADINTIEILYMISGVRVNKTIYFTPQN